MHKSAGDCMRWFHETFGRPSFHVFLTVDNNIIEDRFRVSKEMDAGAELGDEHKEALQEKKAAGEAEKKAVDAALAEFGGKTRLISLTTDKSLETIMNELRSQFCAKVVLINHDNGIPVDTACANLAIKFNMLYVSAYQLIKDHIQKGTAHGKALMASYNPKDLQNARGDADEFEFSAAHYDTATVINLIKDSVQSLRTTQQFILLEGLCNSTKLQHRADQLGMRQMDELFALEKNVGEVNSVVSLLFHAEETKERQPEYEVFEKPVVEEKPKAKVNEEGEEEPPAEEPPADGEVKKVFDPSIYNWSKSSGEPKNLPQLFRAFKGSISDQQVNALNSSEAIAHELDKFCEKLV
jgi:hypothetical protein